jgi:hypothetical protein
VRCWTLAQIDSGRALALTGHGASTRLIGFAASRVRRIRIAAASQKPFTVAARGGVLGQATQLWPGTRLSTRVET